MSSKSTALILIDVINDFNFPAGGKLLRTALPAARNIAALKARCTARKMPAIYVNDNFGCWQESFQDQVQRCRSAESAGREITELLAPAKDDYFVLKPRHSGFYATSLEVLLSYLKIRTLIMTGFATDICEIYTANDAYMREFAVKVPADCVASETVSGNRKALAHIQERLKGDVRPWRSMLRSL